MLPDEIVKNSLFIASTGYSSAISKAKSIAIRLKQQIFLILDSDSAEHTETEEKKEQIEYIFKRLGKSGQVKIFLFEPEIEIIFFESARVKEKLLKIFPQSDTFYSRQLLRAI